MKRGTAVSAYLPTERDFQLNLATELIQMPEVLFQPGIVGLDQCGLGELMANILRRFPLPDALALVENVFLCGASTLFPGFRERIEGELRALLPTGATFKVRAASDAHLDSWRGASRMASHPLFDRICVTYEEWQEKGAHYLAEHRASNCYVPTPPALAPPDVA